MSAEAARRKTLRTSKNAFMLLLGTMVRMVASFAFVLYSARVLGVEGFGRYAIAIHYFEFALSLSATAVGIMLTRDVARWSRNANPLITAALSLAAGLAVVAPFFLIPLGIVLQYSEQTILALAVGCVALLPGAIANMLEAVFVARERAEFVTLGTSLESLLRIAACCVVLWLGYGVVELMLVMVFSRALQLTTYWGILHWKMGFRWEWQWPVVRRFFWRWRVFAAENWMATIYTNLDVVVLSFVSGELAVGLYSAAWKFVRLGSVVAKSFTTAVYPVMSRMYADSKASFARLLRHTVRVLCILALPICVGVTVLPERIVDLLYSAEFADAAPVLRILIWVLVLEFVNPFLSHVLFAQGRQHRSMTVAAISLVFNAFATYWLVSYFDAVGAAAACVLAGLIATVFYMAFSMSRAEVLHVVSVVARVFAAAVGMGWVAFLLRDASWITILGAAGVVYTVLLFVVRACRVEDLAFFRNTFFARATT